MNTSIGIRSRSTFRSATSNRLIINNLKLMVLRLILICFALLASFTAHAQDQSAWDALKNGAAVAIMRHALAPGTGDPANLSLDDCATQRNLSETGRNQALSIGEALRFYGIEQADVLSSAWCRCYETAERLQLGPVVIEPVLNSFFRDRSTAKEQTEQLEAMVRGWINDQSPTKVLVTHQVNITGLTGSWVESGETLIIGLGETGEITILERMLPQ